MPADTELVIYGIGIAPYSARGLTQTLQPDPDSISIARTINGDADNLGEDQFHKYISTISSEDMNEPALDGVFPGMELVVDCVQRLMYRTDTGSPAREVVPGSEVEWPGGFTSYRPRITFLVVDFQMSISERDAQGSWTLSLIEK